MSGLPEESPSVETHWSRILYHDLFSDRATGAARDRDALTGEERVLLISDHVIRRDGGQVDVIASAAGRPRDDANSRPGRSPIAAAAMLLGVFIAGYLAVAGLVRALSTPGTTSVVMRQIGATEGNRLADHERAAFVINSRGNSHA